MAFEPATQPLSWTDGTVLTEVYKVVDKCEIKTDVVIPPGLKAGKHPLIIAIHGGGLLVGSRKFAGYMSAWMPSYAASVSAILVNPDHRLLPSASSADIREDLESLWSWVHNSLPSVLASKAPEHQADLDRILIEGGSAGGFCAAHLAMSHHQQVKGAVIIYGMLDMFSDWFVHGPPNGRTLLDLPESLLYRGEELEKKIKEIKEGGWVTERIPQEGEKSLIGSIITAGKLLEPFEGRKEDSPVERIRLDKTAGLPPRVWVLHGKEDSAVPIEGSQVFVDEVKKAGWKSEVIFDAISDEPSGHGFDLGWTLEKEKLKKRLDWMTESLLG